tara:strand:+ start:377 stop:529 length:153 start_codon:yes stop_codon:yes gene_type:complete
MDNQFLEEIDEINYTIEFLVDQLHDAVAAGDYLEGETLAQKIREKTEANQ